VTGYIHTPESLLLCGSELIINSNSNSNIDIGATGLMLELVGERFEAFGTRRCHAGGVIPCGAYRMADASEESVRCALRTPDTGRDPPRSESRGALTRIRPM
jgi:hypothetical protein